MRCFSQRESDVRFTIVILLASSLILFPGCMTPLGYPGYSGPAGYPPVGCVPGNGCRVGYVPGTGNPIGWGPGPGYPLIPVNGPGGGYPIVGYVPPGVLPPSGPVIPISNPVTPETPDPPPVVVGSPTKPDRPTTPETPPTDPTGFWVSWPLPPRNGSSSQSLGRADDRRSQANWNGRNAAHKSGHPMCSTVSGGSASERRMHESTSLPGRIPTIAERVEGAPATPSEDLIYHGGRIIPHLSFVNLYVGGDEAWSKTDIDRIDDAITAAMSDRRLNNVMRQYFNNAEITTTAAPSHPLVGYIPNLMTKGDVEYSLAYLYDQGFLDRYNLPSTAFNFLLPSGTVLNDESDRQSTAAGRSQARRSSDRRSTLQTVAMAEEDSNVLIPESEEGDSLSGLGGYHGSIHVGQETIYYTVDVYSERNARGEANGIPVFQDSWKNIVATLYHELNELRTDPDVEDVIRDPYAPNAEMLLGWTSSRGEEVGDYPISSTGHLSSVVTEVELADGTGMVPVQFQYSNAVHGPEGPIEQLHSLTR